jgi:hypothetical protein
VDGIISSIVLLFFGAVETRRAGAFATGALADIEPAPAKDLRVAGMLQCKGALSYRFEQSER